jgi:hypothetical protein
MYEACTCVRTRPRHVRCTTGIDFHRDGFVGFGIIDGSVSGGIDDSYSTGNCTLNSNRVSDVEVCTSDEVGGIA